MTNSRLPSTGVYTAYTVNYVWTSLRPSPVFSCIQMPSTMVDRNRLLLGHGVLSLLTVVEAGRGWKWLANRGNEGAHIPSICIAV